ncbi:MAG: hypothetical protein D6798_07200 [Deltaproteobacteria bacterium]|nr:MAG: hypothetical protein D6798_07200 [Deltaproteobacteria bacterium]
MPSLPSRVLPIAALGIAVLLPSPARAKDLRKRFAAGANLQLGELPALSVRYGLPTANPAVNVQVELLAGFRSTADPAPGEAGSRILAMGRVLYGMVAEDNMNLFVGAGAGARSADSTVTTRIEPVLGADFFPFGLENLGFTAECGVFIDIGDQAGAGATVGAGLHYWF